MLFQCIVYYTYQNYPWRFQRALCPKSVQNKMTCFVIVTMRQVTRMKSARSSFSFVTSKVLKRLGADCTLSCVLGRTHFHRCVNLCRSEVVITWQAMLSLVSLGKWTNGSIAGREITTSDLHKLTHRCKCVPPKHKAENVWDKLVMLLYRWLMNLHLKYTAKIKKKVSLTYILMSGSWHLSIDYLRMIEFFLIILKTWFFLSLIYYKSVSAFIILRCHLVWLSEQIFVCLIWLDLASYCRNMKQQMSIITL